MCEEGGCEHCGGTGQFVLTDCPNKFIGDLYQVFPLLDMYEKGHAPVSGGVLDQSAWFVSAYRSLKSEENKIEAERYEDV